MQVTSLFHVSIKTQKPVATQKFYKEVLGMVDAPRPPFEFPGFWLQLPTSVGQVPLHFYTGHAALNDDGSAPVRSGSIDHLAFTAHGFSEMRARCKKMGVPYRERTVPSLTLVQLFFYDPNGIQLELNFNSISEEPLPVIDASNFPRAGGDWFDVASVAHWGDQ